MNDAIEFFVPGVPQPGGSKRGFPYKDKNTGKTRVAIVDSNPKHATTWRASVQGAARAALPSDFVLSDKPVVLSIFFYMRRPKSHYGTGANSDKVKNGSPWRPVTRPDVTKLMRSIEDALTNIIWKDDSQIISQVANKYYAEGNQPPGAQVKVEFYNDNLFDDLPF